jgi:lysophospholipase L1-like esterase
MKPPHFLLVASLAMAAPHVLPARDLQPKPADAFFGRYEIVAAPQPTGLLLQPGDRLAICGDSITEQRQYSVLMEAYLTACLPELGVTVRQFGWSGEQASGFGARLKNDVLRFQPTLATTCYGMNDHRYVPYTDEIGGAYRDSMTAVVGAFKQAGVRVVVGSPGTIASVPGWLKSATGTKEDLNASLCRLRTIGIELAEAQGTGFADVWWPMMEATFAARSFGPDFAVAGKDGVHPAWAGQVVMAAAFLHGLGVTGEVGTVTVDLATSTVTASVGHRAGVLRDHQLEITSERWPFCAPAGPLDKDDSMRAGMALCDFDARFNRLTLKATGLGAPAADVTWGTETRRFTADELAAGVNLAAAFPTNPFSEPFAALWQAVAAKQEYETRQVKTLFHGPEGAVDMEATVALTEKVRDRLAEAVKSARRPVTHTLVIRPAP